MQTPGPMPAHSLSIRQARQTWLSQTGVVRSAQSLETRHGTHFFTALSQTGAPALAQSAFCEAADADAAVRLADRLVRIGQASL